jgi:hypothetical protein
MPATSTGPFGFPANALTASSRPSQGAELVEILPTGIGWHARYSVDGGKVRIEHRGYGINMFGRSFRLPLEWIFGRGAAEEEAIDAQSFHMAMEIVHPLFGKIYGYRGTFEITSVALAE